MIQRWGEKSQRIERALVHNARVYRGRKTGKKIRMVRNFSVYARHFKVSRELVRQIADDLNIRSRYFLLKQRGPRGRLSKNGAKR